jgi:hypothetical protein
MTAAANLGLYGIIARYKYLAFGIVFTSKICLLFSDYIEGEGARPISKGGEPVDLLTGKCTIAVNGNANKRCNPCAIRSSAVTGRRFRPGVLAEVILSQASSVYLAPFHLLRPYDAT